VAFNPDTPLREVEARQLLTKILVDGSVIFSRHALEEMRKDQMVEQDVINVLRAGSFDPAEWEHGGWRYRIHTQRFCVVTAFDSETLAVVVTAWRKR
jgi:hypothetical protein